MWRPDVCRRRLLGLLLAGSLALCAGVRAKALLPPWLQEAVSGSAIEAALFRTMALPGVQVLYPRPPAEAVQALNKLVDGAPNEVALLSLRARQEESALDFVGAARDWKSYAAKTPNKAAATMDLAAFYGRRLAVRDQFATLLEVGALPAGTADRVTATAAQSSWMAFEQALRLAEMQSFEAGFAEPLWQEWIARYRQQPTVYARAFTWELNHGRAAEAQGVLERYRAAFPGEAAFPVKAEALLALARGGADAQARALAVYGKSFAPTWPQDLLNSYFDLLAATHSTRRFVSDAQAQLGKNPDDLLAAGKLFAYYRHESHPEAALAVLADYTQAREARDAAGNDFTPEQMYALEQMAASASAYPDAARYAFGLFHLPGKVPDGRTARETGLAAMIDLLLSAPEQPIALGAGNLSLYRDVGTVDQGPGFWNGVLSLWLNDQGLREQMVQQESKAQPYFHRAEAAALLKLLDAESPNNAQRAAFHAKLIEAYASYGEDGAVLQAGETFLRTFPQAQDRVQVALSMADADARRKDAAAEFSIYDRLLAELGKETGNLPLATAAMQTVSSDASVTQDASSDVATPGGDEDTPSSEGLDADAGSTAGKASGSRAFDLDTGPPAPVPSPAATAYEQVLRRYLDRLTALHQLPQALAVLRKELDRNPDDPKLYERLAMFLSQNNLFAQQEEVYRAAIARFGDRSWYDKLARAYLREKRGSEYAKLGRQVTDIFSGTELEGYFADMQEAGPGLALELNLYAHKRFPHDLVFTQNLLTAYRAKGTRNDAAWERLLRENWWQSPDLTNEFFAFLSRTGKLKAELAALPPESAETGDLAATQERANAALWASHYEAGAPLFDQLAERYPTDESFGKTAADLNRSLAWLDPAGAGPRVAKAVAIEQRLLSANPGDLERLARIGDMLADHADGTPASYGPSAVYWRRMPATAPGDAETYLQAATVFWDYFQFDQALAEIGEARSHFANPALYAYEAGAIREGERDLPGAIREYIAATLAGAAANGAALETDRHTPANSDSSADVTLDLSTNPSADRLLRLARRADTAALVDAATAAELNRNSGLPALQLRVAVLAAEHQGAESAPVLLAAVRRAATVDAEADLAMYAQARGDLLAREAALSREAELTPDPAERLSLRYELAQAFESRNDFADALRIVDASYRDNPRILGVVRATVDFDWRNKRSKQAVDVLVASAHVAQPPLAQQFTAEAAAKATASGDWVRGRALASDLLNAEPYNAQYLSLAAESYARAGDTSGLASFYRARLQAVQTGPMSAGDRRTRTALLRKGLIPALTQAKEYAGAVDQYIALVTAYPEDSALIREAALYAAQYSERDELVAFYRQTVQSSPRDARYFVALAQTEALFGDTEAALEAYTRAVALRPESSDLLIAKTGLEKRLGRFDEAAADYARLYQLSYKDPQWMTAAAEVQARQGHTAEAVRALETAYLHGAQSTPHDHFAIAAQLEAWNLLPEAQQRAEQGAAAAGSDLLAGDAPRIGADDPVVLARILTRQRKTDEAFRVLRSALGAAASSPSSPEAISAQVRTQGLASVTDAAWRKSYVQARQARAETQFDRALNAMAAAVAEYGTPEEHTAFVVQLKAQRGAANRSEVLARWVPAAHAAGLGALEAAWRAEVLNGAGKQGATQLTPFVQLEEARSSFAELGRTLETFLRLHPRSSLRSQAISKSVDAFGAAADTPAQLRLLRQAWAGGDESTVPEGAYLRLLARRDPDALVSLAANQRESVANAATEAALDQPSPELALRAVHARGTALGPLWNANYTALAGLYVHGSRATVRAAFDDTLGLQETIAERLESQGNAATALIGKPWFYLAGRYGQWLLEDAAGTVPADDVLAADLEAGETAADHLALAQTEEEAGRGEAALQETAHALELAPTSATVYEARASLLWKLNRKDEAVAAWSRALQALREVQERGPAPESFWTGFARVAQQVHQHALFAQLKLGMEETLRSYLGRNGTYRSNDLLQAAFESAPSPAEGAAWVISMADAAKDPVEVLNDIHRAPWLPPTQRKAVLESELILLRRGPRSSVSGADEPTRLPSVRAELIRLDLESGDGTQALALLESAPAAARTEAVWQAEEIVASAQTGALPKLLQRFDTQPDTAPIAEAVKTAATSLQGESDAASALAVLEWQLRRVETVHQASSSDYLAVADARLHIRDVNGAVSILASLIARSEDAHTDREAAAALLEKSGEAAKAVPFLEPLARGVPWELSYRVRLAEDETAARTEVTAANRELTAVAANPAAPYALRARAARDLGKAGAGATGLGSAELNLLAANTLTPTAVRQPFFVTARAVAAAGSTDPRIEATLLREALSIAPYAMGAQTMREQLFEAEERTGNLEGAKAVLGSLFAQENSGDTEPLAEAVTENDTDPEGTATPLPQDLNAAPKERRASFAHAIGTVYAASDEEGSAQAYLEYALTLAPAGPEVADVKQQLAALAQQQRLRTANAARRPQIAKQLDQPRIVRVRLTAAPDEMPPATEVQDE